MEESKGESKRERQGPMRGRNVYKGRGGGARCVGLDWIKTGGSARESVGAR